MTTPNDSGEFPISNDVLRAYAASLEEKNERLETENELAREREDDLEATLAQRDEQIRSLRYMLRTFLSIERSQRRMIAKADRPLPVTDARAVLKRTGTRG